MTTLPQLQDALIEARDALRLARQVEAAATRKRQDAAREVERLTTLIETTRKKGPRHELETPNETD